MTLEAMVKAIYGESAVIVTRAVEPTLKFRYADKIVSRKGKPEIQYSIKVGGVVAVRFTPLSDLMLRLRLMHHHDITLNNAR